MTLFEKASLVGLRSVLRKSDLDGQPMFLKLTEILSQLRTEEEKAAVLLMYAVAEKKETFDSLVEQGIPQWVVSAVDALAQRDDELYMDYIDRCKRHPVARYVKIAELQYYLRAEQLALLSPANADKRRTKYDRAIKMLMAPTQVFVVVEEEPLPPKPTTSLDDLAEALMKGAEDNNTAIAVLKV